MGCSASVQSSSRSINIPDINSMPTAERSKAIEDLIVNINSQMIKFGFRQVDPAARGKAILESVAQGMSFLPGYAIRIEGHSNLTKSEGKLTVEDKDRIQKLSEDRADACARLLKAAGVQNEMTCVGQGALMGATKGCVRIVVFPKEAPPQVEGSNPEQPKIQDDQPEIHDVLPTLLTGINDQKIRNVSEKSSSLFDLGDIALEFDELDGRPRPPPSFDAILI